MARTRAQRRRQNVTLAIAVVATLLVLLFARDVTRAAHGSSGVRRSENRTFGVLANTLVTSENAWDQHLGYLLDHGETLSRSVFAARLDQLAEQLPFWSNEAALLRRPVLAHDVNATLAQLTDERAADYESVIAAVASSLGLPVTGVASGGPGSTSAGASIYVTDEKWGVARFSLVREPGLVKLDATTTSPDVVALPDTLRNLGASASLALVRGISIAAVSVRPAPLPAPAGTLVLPPVTSLNVGVSVTNDAYDVQRVSLTVTLMPTNRVGAIQRRRMTVTLGPLQSYAFVPTPLATAPSERATLTIVAGGAPGGAGLSRMRTYRFILSPSGNG